MASKPGRMKLLLWLLLMALPGAPLPAHPTPCLVVTDPGYDVDDETALIPCSTLQRRSVLDVRLTSRLKRFEAGSQKIFVKTSL